jgi:hypothetical protein
MEGDARFKILKWSHRTPLMAECAKCHLKFITPERMLKADPMDVKYYLRTKYAYHTCHPSDSPENSAT